MRGFNKVGSIVIRRLTFAIIFVLFSVTFLARSCFDSTDIPVTTDDVVPTATTTTTTISDGELNVAPQRSLYNYNLLPPYEASRFYGEDVETPLELEVVDFPEFNAIEDIEFYADLDLSLDILPLKSKLLANDISIDIKAPKLVIPKTVKKDIVETTVEAEFAEDVFFEEDLMFDEEFFFEDDLWDDGFFDDFNTPFEPFLFDPLVQTQEEYDFFKPKDTLLQELDDDFFSDFYIAGESDQSLYEDGVYFLSLFVNGDEVGDVETKFEGADYYIGAQSLYNNIYRLLSESGVEKLFSDAPEYYTVEQLESLNVPTRVDVDSFTVSMEFGIDDIPVQLVSITKVEKNVLLNRNEQYGISDAEELKPSFFSLVTSLNLSTNYTYGPALANNILRTSLSMSHAMSLGGVAIDLSNSFSYSPAGGFDASISRWTGFFNVRDKNLRITFGNTGSFLGLNGTPVGFTIEKNYSYGTGFSLPHAFTRRYLLEADSIMYLYANDDDPVIKSLRKGEYILRDFPLKQGGNNIRIRIEPKDEAYPIILDEFNIPYDSRLLAKGDYLFGFGAAISKSEKSGPSSTLVLPYLDGKLYEYDFADFTTNFYLNVGVTNTFTLKSSFAFSTKEIQSSFDGVLATMAGPFSTKLTANYREEYSPSVYASLSHSIPTLIGDINSSITLKLPVWESATGQLKTPTELDLTLGHSLGLDDLPPLNTSFTATFNSSGIKWKTSLSTNYSPLPGLSFNGALNISNKAYTSELDISLQLGIGFTLLENLSASKSLSSKGSSSLSLSYKPSDVDSLQFNIGGIQYLRATNPIYNLSWQHTGENYSLMFKQNISDDFNRYNTSASVSSALFFADGLFAISRSSANNFIILKPTGDLANNPVSVGKTSSSSLKVIDTIFGNAVYTQLSANSKNNLIAYGTSKSLYSSGGSFSYALNTLNRTGFAKTLYSPPSYTVSGLLLQEDGTPFEQYSSPVYRILEDENGLEYLVLDDQLYLFTDLDGRFILSSVGVGTYLFDMAAGANQWYGLYFTVEDGIDPDAKVLLLNDFKIEAQDEEITTVFEVVDEVEEEEKVSGFGDELASDYVDIIELTVERYEDEETFWNTIFPPLDEDVDDLAFEDTAGDWESFTFEEDLFEDDLLEEDVFFDDPAFADTAEDWESLVDLDDITTVVIDERNDNPNLTYVP